MVKIKNFVKIIIAFSFIFVFAFSACGSVKPKNILINNSPFYPINGSAETQKLVFNKDGTYEFSLNTEYISGYDGSGNVIKSPYQNSTIGKNYTEVLTYEYKYYVRGELVSIVTHTKDGWISIYKLEDCNHYFKDLYGGDIYVALDGYTDKYGKITVFQYDKEITTDYLDQLREDIYIHKDGGYIPLSDVGCEVEVSPSYKKNVNGHNYTIANDKYQN